MPAWDGRLNKSTIKALTVYVHTFGGGEKLKNRWRDDT